jgi:hypothetical protein
VIAVWVGGPKGFPEAIAAVPQTSVQTCVVAKLERPYSNPTSLGIFQMRSKQV